MKTFQELQTENRGAPCLEYPGKWLVYKNGNDPKEAASAREAQILADVRWGEDREDTTVSVCWECSDNDPRVGKVWFTPFYCLGTIDAMGCWKS